VGTETDIVSKEMYSFTDRGDRAISLRPEGTAGAARAYIEHKLSREEPIQKWYYAGPMFRAERPQKGRYRQFYQVGAEFFGVADPTADVELLCLLRDLCARLGLADVQLKINTLGDQDSRAAYRQRLGDFLSARQDALCGQCAQRAKHNPLRVLDCKVPACRALLSDAPDILDALTPASRAWFDRYLGLLDAQNIAYTRDRMLVRGLDYYSDAIFEMTTDALGSQDAILGGGRYDTLVQSLGGPQTPAVGFGAGIERLALLLAQKPGPTVGPDIYLAPFGPEFASQALTLASALRGIGRKVELDSAFGRIKQAMRRADKQGAQTVLVLGADEVAQKTATLKRLADGATAPCSLHPDSIQQAFLALTAG
jgi:histidyl-tRNA synthetase